MTAKPVEDQANVKVPTILIVEDNPPTMELLKEYFILANEKGHLRCDTIQATNGQEAITIIDVAQSEIILCDIQLPQKDGFEVLSYFNKWSKIQNPYSFFCFFSNTDEEKARAFKEGADGFVAKKSLDYYPLTLQLRSWFKLVAFERKYGEQMK